MQKRHSNPHRTLAGPAGLFIYLYLVSYGPLSHVYWNSSSEFYDLWYEVFYLPVDALYNISALENLIDAWQDYF